MYVCNNFIPPFAEEYTQYVISLEYMISMIFNDQPLLVSCSIFFMTVLYNSLYRWYILDELECDVIDLYIQLRKKIHEHICVKKIQ